MRRRSGPRWRARGRSRGALTSRFRRLPCAWSSSRVRRARLPSSSSAACAAFERARHGRSRPCGAAITSTPERWPRASPGRAAPEPRRCLQRRGHGSSRRPSSSRQASMRLRTGARFRCSLRRTASSGRDAQTATSPAIHRTLCRATRRNGLPDRTDRTPRWRSPFALGVAPCLPCGPEQIRDHAKRGHRVRPPPIERHV